jgi:hypothetical protein
MLQIVAFVFFRFCILHLFSLFQDHAMNFEITKIPYCIYWLCLFMFWVQSWHEFCRLKDHRMMQINKILYLRKSST